MPFPKSTFLRRGRKTAVFSAISAPIERLEERWLFSNYYDNAQAASNGAGTQSSPWNSLSAIASFTGFQSGDEVKLSGTFTDQTLALGASAAGLTITSADPTQPATIAESSGYSFYDAIQVTTSGVTISYLNMTGPGITASNDSNAGIEFLNAGTTQLTGATVDHVTESGFVFAGLNFQGNTSGFTNVTVSNSTFNDNQVSGVVLTGVSLKVRNGTGAARPEIFNNVMISNVTASGNAGAAIYFNENDLGPTQNSNNGGIYVAQVNGCVITHCTAIGDCYNSYGACAIWAHNSDGVNVEYCEAADTRSQSRGFDGNGFDFDHDVSNSIMQYDYSHGNDGIGLYMCSFSGAANCNNDTIRYCISDDDGRHANFGCRIYGAPGVYVTNANIYDNTILSTDGSEVGFGLDGSHSGAFGCTVNFVNNIIYTANDSEAVEFPNGAPSLDNVKMEGNDYWVTGYGTNTFKLVWGTTTYQSFSDFVAGTGEETINGHVVGKNVDPLLNSEAVTDLPIANVSNLALSRQSPLRGAGLVLTAPPFSNTAPYSSNSPYNIGGSAWGGIGSQDYFGSSLNQTTANDVGAGSAISSLMLTGRSSGDTFTLTKDASNPNSYDVNGTVYKSASSIIINGAAGNETVVADFANGAFNFTFNGGTGVNSLIMKNDTVGVGSTQSVIFNPNGDSNAVNVSAGTITIPASTQSGFRQAKFSNITIGAGGLLMIADPTSPNNRTLVTVDASELSLGGTLDLGGNDLVIRNGDESVVNSLIRAGINGLTQGAIIGAPQSQNTTLASTLNSADGSSNGAVLFSTFDSSAVANTDVLVKYTYNGDTNFDGVIDSTDYSRIDAGYINHLGGWANGDLNYDGVINGSDYTLIDNAYNTHGVSLASQVAKATPFAVPRSIFVGQNEEEAADPLHRSRGHRSSVMEMLEKSGS